MRTDTVMAVLMGCALLWWIGRGMGWTTRLGVAAVTLLIVLAVLWAERTLP